MASTAAGAPGSPSPPVPPPPAFVDKPAIEVPHKGLLQFGIMVAVLLQILDGTIANVALPHMQAALGASQDSISWVLTSYIIATAVAIPITGWLADRFGARTLMIVSVGGFVGASMLCGIAQNLPEMVFFRLIQGVSGAFITPLSQSYLYDINPPSQQARAVSLFGQGIMVGPVVGPVLGGFLTENLDWRWVFFINVPLGVMCLILLIWLLPPNKKQPRHFNLFAFVMLTLAVGGLQLFLDRGERIDWFDADETWITLGVMAAAAWMFVINQLNSPRPLYRRSMFKDRNIAVGCVLMFSLGLVTMSAMALLPPLLQGLLGYGVEEAGMLMAPRGLVTIFSMFIASRMTERMDPRIVLCIGFLITGYSMWMMTGWSLDMDWRTVVFSGAVQGFGLGLVFVPLNVVTFSTISRDARTDAVSLISLMRNMGQSIGITIMTVLIAQNTQINHADIASYMTPQHLGGLTSGMIESLGDTSEAALMFLNGEVSRQAAMISYLNDFKLMMIGAFACPLLLLFMDKPKLFNLSKKSPEDAVHME